MSCMSARTRVALLVCLHSIGSTCRDTCAVLQNSQTIHKATTCHQADVRVCLTGKLDLYCAAAGFHPGRVLPCVIDVGTDNEALRNDPMYMGLQHPRLQGDAYFEVPELPNPQPHLTFQPPRFGFVHLLHLSPVLLFFCISSRLCSVVLLCTPSSLPAEGLIGMPLPLPTVSCPPLVGTCSVFPC